MYSISIPLVLGEDPKGNAVLGFMHKDRFIFDPYRSWCNNYETYPAATYGLDLMEASELGAMNRAIQHRAEQAMEAIRLDVHMSLGWPDDSKKVPVDHEACQQIAQAIALETLRLLGQSPEDE